MRHTSNRVLKFENETSSSHAQRTEFNVTACQGPQNNSGTGFKFISENSHSLDDVDLLNGSEFR